MRRVCAPLLLLLPLTALSACTTVRAWERDDLAREDMAWTPDAQDAALAGHIQFSKEASMPGGSAGGGGCGCN